MFVLTTREWATIIWSLVFFAYVFIHEETRKALIKVIKTFFDKKLRILWEIILLYVLIITKIFSCFPIWKNIYIKDITVWFAFSGLIICMNAVSAKEDETYIKKVLIENLKFTIVVEFIISTFTFNIWIELLIIPIATILIIMDFIAARDEKYYDVHKFLQIVLGLVGLWLVYKTIKVAFIEYSTMNVWDTFVSFIIPIVYLIMMIPLEFVLQLYSKYELLFLRMTFKECDNKKIRKYHRFSILKVCKFSVSRVLFFQREYLNRMFNKMTEEEFESLIEEFKIDVKSEKISKR